MIVDVTGFGWSGSGAVHDLLREYDDVQFAAYDFDWEFTLLWMVDGIADLDHKLSQKHCRYCDSDIAIQRFLRLTKALEKTPGMRYDIMFKGNFYRLCEKYIQDLTQVVFEARNFDELIYPDIKERVCRFLRILFGNRYSRKILPKEIVDYFVKSNNHTIRLSYNPSRFIERTQKLMGDFLTYVRNVEQSEKPLITDQLFPPDIPNMFYKYLEEETKCIVVRRDPRDLYLLAKNEYNAYSIPIPVKKVEDFIIFYKKTIEETLLSDNNRLLSIYFEDLIYNYDSTVSKIEKFVGISNHKFKNKFFDPSKSINNTQLFNLYEGFEDDVKQIKDALPNSLFQFDNYHTLGKNRSQIF